VRAAIADEWIAWERQNGIYVDGDFTPPRRAATLLRVNAVCAAWGLPRIEEPPKG
jgi:hypothetical protein